MQFDYSLIDEQLVITDPKDFHYNCDEHPVDGDKLIIDMPTDEVKALCDYLDTELERYQATRRNPEEPEPIEDGFYVTQDGTLIYRDSGNQPCEYIVYTDPPTYYYYWRHVYEDLDASALPLTHVTVDDFRKLVRK